MDKLFGGFKVENCSLVLKKKKKEDSGHLFFLKAVGYTSLLKELLNRLSRDSHKKGGEKSCTEDCVKVKVGFAFKIVKKTQ